MAERSLCFLFRPYPIPATLFPLLWGLSRWRSSPWWPRSHSWLSNSHAALAHSVSHLCPPPALPSHGAHPQILNPPFAHHITNKYLSKIPIFDIFCHAGMDALSWGHILAWPPWWWWPPSLPLLLLLPCPGSLHSLLRKSRLYVPQNHPAARTRACDIARCHHPVTVTVTLPMARWPRG